ARFYLQASDLDHKPGAYAFTIVLVENGYSSTLLNGEIDLQQNTEYSSVNETYSDTSETSTLRILLQKRNIIQVQTGPTLAPGQSLFTNAMEQKLLEIYAGALADGQTLDAD